MKQVRSGRDRSKTSTLLSPGCDTVQGTCVYGLHEVVIDTSRVHEISRGLRCSRPAPARVTSRVGHATDIKPHLLGPGPCLSVHWMLFLFCLFALSACAFVCSFCLCSEVTVTSYSPPPSVSLRGILLQHRVEQRVSSLCEGI